MKPPSLYFLIVFVICGLAFIVGMVTSDTPASARSESYRARRQAIMERFITQQLTLTHRTIQELQELDHEQNSK